MASGAWEWQGANSWSAGRLDFISYSNGASANSSRVDVHLYARRTDGGNSYNYSAYSNFWVQCNGSIQFGTYQQVAGSNWTMVCAQSFTVPHNSDGTKTVTISGGGAIPGSTFNINSFSVDVALDNIPRYATITQWNNTGVTQSSASFKWGTDAACDSVQYSLNNGSWVNTSGNEFTIKNLTPNTSYSVKINVRRQDSLLWSQSGILNIKTLPIASLSNGENLEFDIGSDLLLYFKDYNMNSSNIKFSIQKEGTTDEWIENVMIVSITSGTEEYSLLTSSVANQLYQNCTTSNQVRFRIECNTDIDGETYGNVYYGTAHVVNSNPTFNNFLYGNTDSHTQEMLGNTSYILQNYGNMQARIPSNLKAVGKNYATIVSYIATVTNSSNVIQSTKEVAFSSSSEVTIDFGMFSTVGTYNINMLALDSRGNVSPVIKHTFYVLEYHIPTLNVTIDRANHFEKEVLLNLSSVYSKVLLTGVQKNNSFKIQFRYREAGSTIWSSYSSITDYTSTSSSATEMTVTVARDASNPLISLSSEKSYDFEIVVSDRVTSTSNTYTLIQGIPIMIEGDNGVIGIGMVPDWDDPNLLQVGSDIIATDSDGIQKAILKELSKIILPSDTEPTDQSENYIWLKTM